MPDLFDLAYAAGLIDGEGSIGIYGKKLLPVVTVGMTDLEPVQWLADTFGGAVVSHWRPEEQRKHWKPVYRWQASTKAAYIFCRAVLPFLKVKHRQALLVIRFYEEGDATSPLRKSDAERERRAALKAVAHILNQRGVPDAV